MNNVYLLIITIIIPVFFGLLVGGIIGKVSYSIMKQKVSLLYISSGGLLIGFIFFELIPESIKEYNFLGILLGSLLGMIGMVVFDKTLHNFDNTALKESTQSVVFLVIAISFHNIPTGFAIGSGLTNGSSFTSSLLIAMILHHIPEGIALLVSVYISNYKFLTFVSMALVLAIILGVSVLFGQSLLIDSYKTSSLIMGGAIGTFSFVSLFEILLRGYKKVSRVEFIIFLVLGLGIIKIYLLILG